MLAFIQAHLAAEAAFAIALIDLGIDFFHPSDTVTGVLNWILPFLRRSAGQ